ncbi:CHAT domain-containing [Fusarium albosuccineum]|uniref:CHAT domain-containing n=1 Tax=Fusarium albosuccineum TaxID=1237068 RepID=A0A8H4LPE9_9HYPO|nr:CHAT domain-containing [Fusarium albosuccineum]
MLCQVRERSFHSETNEWAISLEACGESHELILHNPFSATEAEEVDWFFQHYSKFPLADTTRAGKVVKAIKNYGKELFRQTIGAVSSDDSLTWKRFAELREKGELDELRIEILGSAAFQQLYWEALQDDQPGFDDRPLALRAEVIRRPLAATGLNRPTRDISRDTSKTPSETLHATPSWSLPSRPLNILLVVARPAGLEDVGLRFISAPILDALYSPAPDRTLQARLDVVRPGSFEELQSKLEKASARGLQYDIAHFDMHGKVSRDRKEYAHPCRRISPS